MSRTRDFDEITVVGDPDEFSSAEDIDARSYMSRARDFDEITIVGDPDWI